MNIEIFSMRTDTMGTKYIYAKMLPCITWYCRAWYVPKERKKTVSDYKNAKEFHFVKDSKSQSKSFWAYNFKAHLHRKKEGRTGKNHKPTTL